MSMENRHQPRIAFVEMVTLITARERTYVSQSENISLSGIFLIRENPLPPGTEGLLSMKINSGSMKKTVNSRFRVMRTGASQQGLEGMGIEFIGMSGEDRSILEEAMELNA